MKKSISFKNINSLISFFFNNSLHGLLNRPLLKKKRTKITILIILLFLYLVYFLYNMKELLMIIPDDTIASDILLQGQKTTFFSFFSNSLTLAIMISIFINNTLALDKTSLFFVKTLPFNKIDLKISYLLFKFSIMFFIYELVMLITTPAIQLVTINPFEYIIFFIDQHLFFFNIIILIELLKSSIDVLLTSYQQISEFFLDVSLLIGSTVYFFNSRYSLEMTLATTTLKINYMIMLSLILNIFLLIFTIYILVKLPSSDRIKNLTKFIKIPLLKGPILRYKSNISIILFSVLIIFIIFLQNSYNEVITILPTILSFSGILFLNYADITADFRMQYDLLRINNLKEWMEQLKASLLFSMPLCIIIYFSHGDWTQVMLSTSLSSFAIIMGYLFPKSKGNLNETSSLFLLIIICILLTLLIKNVSYSLIIMIISLILHYTTVKKVRHEIIL
ncbi:hypothetical protein [Enterococcus hirae]|uniref:hypothetical protein n=1 Tax=Enterococcus hirae TaxID=1354 RepID=UPI001377659A|nr:hypothetical protein [Enterococcus hirae]NBA57116.1 hypothetical protein [Enterococcus hirae]